MSILLASELVEALGVVSTNNLAAVADESNARNLSVPDDLDLDSEMNNLDPGHQPVPVDVNSNDLLS